MFKKTLVASALLALFSQTALAADKVQALLLAFLQGYGG